MRNRTRTTSSGAVPAEASNEIRDDLPFEMLAGIAAHLEGRDLRNFSRASHATYQAARYERLIDNFEYRARTLTVTSGRERRPEECVEEFGNLLKELMDESLPQNYKVKFLDTLGRQIHRLPANSQVATFNNIRTRAQELGHANQILLTLPDYIRNWTEENQRAVITQIRTEATGLNGADLTSALAALARCNRYLPSNDRIATFNEIRMNAAELTGADRGVVLAALVQAISSLNRGQPRLNAFNLICMTAAGLTGANLANVLAALVQAMSSLNENQPRLDAFNQIRMTAAGLTGANLANVLAALVQAMSSLNRAGQLRLDAFNQIRTDAVEELTGTDLANVLAVLARCSKSLRRNDQVAFINQIRTDAVELTGSDRARVLTALAQDIKLEFVRQRRLESSPEHLAVLPQIHTDAAELTGADRANVLAALVGRSSLLRDDQFTFVNRIRTDAVEELTGTDRANVLAALVQGLQPRSLHQEGQSEILPEHLAVLEQIRMDANELSGPDQTIVLDRVSEFINRHGVVA